MTNTSRNNNPHNSLQKRDWILLPLLAVAAPCLLLFFANLMLRPIYTTTNHRLSQCLNYAHPGAGIPGIPNCTTYDKSFDTPLIQYTFNQCGLRSESGCERSAPDTYTIAMVGSSVPLGQWVPFHQSIAAMLQTDLADSTHRKIAVENFARMEEFPPLIPKLLPRVLNTAPDNILLVISPYDLQVSSADPTEMMNTARMTSTSRFKFWTDYFMHAIFSSSPSEAISAIKLPIHNIEQKSRLGTFTLDFIDSNKSIYLRSSLIDNDTGIGYLSINPSSFWMQDYLKFENYVQVIAQTAKSHHIAFQVALVPSRPQEVMLNSGSWPAGYDPYFLDRKVQSIVTASGGTFLDIFPACARDFDLEKHYYIQNGHPDGIAQTRLARMISDAMLRNPSPSIMGKTEKKPSQKGAQ